MADNKSTIDVGALDKLPKVIDMVIEAVLAGELDKVLKAASVGDYRAAVLIPNLVSATICRRHCIIGMAGAPP